MSAIVYEKPVNGPATHAIVIGVGDYPHLPGGGMGQLKSPPYSAHDLARWLIEKYNCPAKPLASVSLLVSAATASPFTFKVNNIESSINVTPAVMPQVKLAVREWRERGHQNTDHVLLFFFCGHGIAAGTDLALLLSDFGEVPTAPLEGAINFGAFLQGMDECKAREQCYFVDACREGSELLIKNYSYRGDPIIQSTGNIPDTNGHSRRLATFFSTLAGAKAYAAPGKPSVFTHALIQALSGLGSTDDDGGPWQVKTTRIQIALEYLMQEASKELKLSQAQFSITGDLAAITLNEVNENEFSVPVTVVCEPEVAISKAYLQCRDSKSKVKKERRPVRKPWCVTLPVGIYDVSAIFKSKAYKDAEIQKSVSPPQRRVVLKTPVAVS